MTSFRAGWSLRHGLCPENQAELDKILANIQCPACDKTRCVPDMGEVYNLGLLLYREILCICSCGFQLRLFVVINDLRRKETPLVASSADALARAVARGLLGDHRIDEGFTHLMLAQFTGDQVQALELAESLISLDPQHSLAWFNLGWSYARVGRWLEAVAAYRKALELEPDFAEAHYHESRMWYRLGYLEKGLEAARKHHASSPTEKDPLPEVVVEGLGAYGRVRVYRDVELLHLYIGQQDQGALYLDPAAERCYANVTGPGPFSPCFQVNSLILAGLSYPEGHFLMLGLGLGAGVVGLLHHLPQCRLTVVEADELVVRLAFEQVPLLAFFEAQGRLNVVAQEATVFLDGDQDHYEAVLVDLFQGENHQPLTDVDFLRDLHQRCDSMWLNLIGKLSDSFLSLVLRNLEEVGKPARFLSASVSSRSWLNMDANWFLSTKDVDLDASAGFVPLDSFEGEALQVLHGQLRMLQRWHLRHKDIKAFLTKGELPSFGD